MLCAWERKHERRTAALFAGGGEITPHSARQIAADRESEPQPAGYAGWAGTELDEWLEDAFELCRRNSIAGVGHLHARHGLTVGGNRLHDAAPGWDYVTGLGTPRVEALTRATVQSQPLASDR